MKFAKVLFFVCFIGICAAAAIERATSKAEAEYTSATKAVKVEVGYKEMMQMTTTQNIQEDAFNKNHRVRISDGTGEVETQLDVIILKTNAFNSGIAFFFKDAPKTAVVTNNMVKLNTNTWYIPYNTITNSCKLVNEVDPKIKLYIVCDLENKTGVNVFKIFFLDLEKEFRTTMLVNYINQDLDSRKSARRSFIQKKFMDVASGVYSAMNYQYKIAAIKKSDAEILSEKNARITKIKADILTLTTSLGLFQKQKINISQELQTIQTKNTNTYNKRQKKITYRLSLEKTISTLESTISGPEQLAKLQEEITKALQQIKYWLQGSVYHRVINETEKAALIVMIGEDVKFDTKINDFFYPQ